MKVAINARFLIKDKLEGIGWYTHELVRRMVVAHPEVEFHLYFDRPYDPQFIYGPNVVPHVLRPPARHPVLWYLWFEVALPLALRRLKPDVFFSPDNFLSLRSAVPTVLTCHDLLPFSYPEGIPSLARRYYQYFWPKYLRHAAHVVTVSETTKQEAIRLFGLPAPKMTTVYNACRAGFAPVVEPVETTLGGNRNPVPVVEPVETTLGGNRSPVPVVEPVETTLGGNRSPVPVVEPVETTLGGNRQLTHASELLRLRQILHPNSAPSLGTLTPSDGFAQVVSTSSTTDSAPGGGTLPQVVSTSSTTDSAPGGGTLPQVVSTSSTTDSASGVGTLASEKEAESSPYFLAAGSIHPRKNIAQLIRAFDQFKIQTGLPHQLVLAGRMAWQNTDVATALSDCQHRADVICTGYVSDTDLQILTRHASCAVYISLMEGFGLPIIEAMQSGVPVITSNTSCLPEIAGRAAVLVQPTNTVAITWAMQKVATDTDTRKQLIINGLARAKEFSWDTAATTIFQILVRIAAKGGRS
jgi:glycosyltransferase involved in cell wall biosynthesis